MNRGTVFNFQTKTIPKLQNVFIYDTTSVARVKGVIVLKTDKVPHPWK